jgi:CDP-diacylglycerol--serine O-phosphatidyltransferase
VQENLDEVSGKKLSMHIYVLPNLVTTANLFFGFFAVIQAIAGNFTLSAYAIVAAAVFDLLDGRLARMTRSTSKFGAEYDSLCDLVSFGMAPAILMYMWALQPFGRLGWLASFMYVACAALRLARFNVQANVIEKAHFQGLPSPMAAGIVASSVLAIIDLEMEPVGNPWLLGMTFLLGIVMVSTFRYRSFKDLEFKERLPFRYLVLGVGLIAVVALRPEVNLFLLFITYTVLGAVFGVVNVGKKVRHRRKSRPVHEEAHELDDLIEEEEDESQKT